MSSDPLLMNNKTKQNAKNILNAYIQLVGNFNVLNIQRYPLYDCYYMTLFKEQDYGVRVGVNVGKKGHTSEDYFLNFFNVYLF